MKGQGESILKYQPSEKGTRSLHATPQCFLNPKCPKFTNGVWKGVYLGQLALNKYLIQAAGLGENVVTEKGEQVVGWKMENTDGYSGH